MGRLPVENVSRIRQPLTSLASWAPAVRLAYLLLLGTSASACADVLGIDSPQVRDLGAPAGDAGQVDQVAGAGSVGTGVGGSGAGSLSAGDSGASDSGAGGEPPSQGGAADGGPRIVGPESTPVCPGAPIKIELSVVGGQGPYVWQLDDSSTLQLQTAGTDHEQATLSGTTDHAMQVSVQARDHDGHAAPFLAKVELLTVPVIQQLAVDPAICPGEVVDTQLKAAGGIASSYQWSSEDLPASSGLVLSADGRLTGKFSGLPAGPASLSIHVNVADGGQCVAAPLALNLQLQGGDATVCPTIKISGELSPKSAPALCLGGAYERQLSASGGTAPYVWTASVHPPGIAVAANGAIAGTYQPTAPSLPAAEPLTVQVTDGNGKTIEAKYQISTRSSCWFAYIAKSATDAKLSFFDAELGNRKLAPAAGAGDVVTDFKFSPNGRYLAYRVTTAASVVALSLIDLVSWQEQRFGFQAVTQYAWSPDSAILGVAYSVGSDGVLGGVAVGASGGGSFSTLTPIAATAMSELVWFGVNPPQLGFVANNGGFPVLEAVGLQTSDVVGFAFSVPVFRTDSLPPPIHFQTSGSGVFAIPKTVAIIYYPSDGSTSRSHSKVVVAPSGRFVAKAATGSVLVFHPTESSKGTTPLTLTGCDSLLTWAGNRERIACAHQTVESTGELNFFDLTLGASPSSDTLSLSSNLPLQVPKTQRRLFSPNGDVFAFASDSSLTIASATKNASKIYSEPAGESTELLFAGDQLLLQHRGTRLSWFDLSLATPIEMPINDTLTAATPCVEDFQDVTSGWCGAERPGAPYMWSPDAKSVAFQVADGTLKIYELFSGEQIPINDECKQDCVTPGQYRFQP
ncbi:MAG: hypothetical protein ABUL62_22960 [Myxococcales bacterium]